NADASRRARAAGIRCATDVTGFGLLGHLFKLARASGVSAVIDRAAVPLIDGTRAAARAGPVPGGSRRNLQWVLPHTAAGPGGRGVRTTCEPAGRRRWRRCSGCRRPAMTERVAWTSAGAGSTRGAWRGVPLCIRAGQALAATLRKPPVELGEPSRSLYGGGY